MKKKELTWDLRYNYILSPAVVFMSVAAHLMLAFGAMVVEGGGVVGQLGLCDEFNISHVID